MKFDKVVKTEDHWLLQDNTFVATFSKTDGPKVKATLDSARNLGANSRFMESIHEGMKRKWSGEYIKKGLYEPLAVQFKRDKVQVVGMEIFNQNIMHQSTTLLNWMAVGSGTSQTFENQVIMQSEISRDDCLLHGYMRAEGLFLMWDNIYDINTPTFNCTEIGLFDSSTAGTMGARAVLAAAVPHSSGNDYLYVQYFIVTMSS